MSRLKEAVAKLRDRATSAKARVPAVKTATVAYAAELDTAAQLCRTYSAGFHALDGGGPSGYFVLAVEADRSKRRTPAIAVYDLEVAFSSAYIAKTAGLTNSGLLPDVSTPAFGIASTGAPAISLDRSVADVCKVLALDQAAVAVPTRAQSQFSTPRSLDCVAWIVASIRLLRSSTVLRIELARGPRLCSINDILDDLAYFWHASQVGIDGLTPLTQAPDDNRGPSIPVCAPTRRTCRHLYSFLTESIRQAVNAALHSEIDVGPQLALMTTSLGMILTPLEAVTSPNVSLLCQSSQDPPRVPGAVEFLPSISQLHPGADAGVAILKSLLHTLLSTRIRAVVQGYEDRLGDAFDLYPSVVQIDLDVNSQTIAMTFDIEIKGKAEFTSSTPLGDVSVTMRVTKERRYLLRLTPQLDTEGLKIAIAEEAILDDPDVDIDFSPDIINSLSGAMGSFRDKVTAAVNDLIPEIDDTITVIDGQTVSVLGFLILIDRFALFITIPPAA